MLGVSASPASHPHLAHLTLSPETAKVSEAAGTLAGLRYLSKTPASGWKGKLWTQSRILFLHFRDSRMYWKGVGEDLGSNPACVTNQ